MFRFVAFFALLSVTFADSLRQCQQAGSGPAPLNAEVVGCSGSPCVLPQSQESIINVMFIAPRESIKLTTLATAFIPMGGMNMPIAISLGDNSDACASLTNALCPVREGEELNYSLKLFVEPFFPIGTRVDVEFRVVDDTSAAVFCIRIPVLVGAPGA